MVILRAKVGVVGDATTGKSSLVKMFCDRSFPQQYSLTLGASLSTSKQLAVPVKVQEEATDAKDDIDIDGNDAISPTKLEEKKSVETEQDYVELYIFDVGGSSIYESSIPSYLENINAFIIVYDATNPESFTSATTKWYDLCKSKRLSPNNSKLHNHLTMPGLFVSTKNDMKDFMQVNSTTAENFARTHNLEFFQLASNSDNGSVDQAFLFLADKIYNVYKERVNMVQYICEN
ncbi:intraflagellar transport protein 27 [Acrasis kona]|uniref:Intraflagellar transport protein 27 n=1 Tax=Acrasis kona TaxID=1008807 RepID=A0AAW2Z2X4_9EUKA